MKRLLPLLLLAACQAAAPRTGTIYVSDETTNVIHVIDAGSLAEKARIAVGHRPRGMAVSPDHRTLYVALGNDNRIAAVDLAQRRVVGLLPCGPDPETIAISPDGRMLYAANENDNLLSMVDIASRRVTRGVPVGGEPEGTAVSPDGKLVIQASETASMAHVIDAATAKVIDNLMVDTRPRYIAFTPDGSRFWVSSEVRATVTVFDTATRRRIGTMQYVWWAQRRGNLRETLKAGRCDLVPGVGSTIEGIATSAPYYRSSYMVVTRPGSGLETLNSFDDPRLKKLRIGVQLIGDDGVNTPPAHALMHRGIVENVRGFMVQGDYRRKFPQDAILDALAGGTIDVAYVWGPVAGYYALRHSKAVTIRPVSPAFDGP